MLGMRVSVFPVRQRQRGGESCDYWTCQWGAEEGTERRRRRTRLRSGIRNSGQSQLAQGGLSRLLQGEVSSLSVSEDMLLGAHMPDPLLSPQTVLFWTCEKYPYAKDWRVFSKGLLRLARKLHKCVRQRFLKHFFVRSGNLLEHATAAELDAVAQRLGLFLKDPGGLLAFHSGLVSVDGSSQVPDSCPGERHQAAMEITLTTSTSEA